MDIEAIVKGGLVLIPIAIISYSIYSGVRASLYVRNKLKEYDIDNSNKPLNKGKVI